MRNCFIAIVAASAVAVGAAQAAPFGPASHRLGGNGSASTQSTEAARPMTLIEAVLDFVGFKLSASVEPVVGDTYIDRTGKTRQCDEAKNAEVAKAEPKENAPGGASKGRTRSGEPVYLAF